MQRIGLTVKGSGRGREDDVEVADTSAIEPTPAEAAEIEQALAEADQARPEDWIPAAAVLRR